MDKEWKLKAVKQCRASSSYFFLFIPIFFKILLFFPIFAPKFQCFPIFSNKTYRYLHICSYMPMHGTEEKFHPEFYAV